MKLFLSSLLFLFSFSITEAQTSDTTHGASIKFLETEFDFGIIKKGMPVTHSFYFVNAGDAPLVIEDAATSCTCDVTDFENKPVMPGDTGVVVYKYNAGTYGVFNKTFRVRSNGSHISIPIYVKGRVEDE